MYWDELDAGHGEMRQERPRLELPQGSLARDCQDTCGSGEGLVKLAQVISELVAIDERCPAENDRIVRIGNRRQERRLEQLPSLFYSQDRATLQRLE